MFQVNVNLQSLLPICPCDSTPLPDSPIHFKQYINGKIITPEEGKIRTMGPSSTLFILDRSYCDSPEEHAEFLEAKEKCRVIWNELDSKVEPIDKMGAWRLYEGINIRKISSILYDFKLLSDEDYRRLMLLVKQHEKQQDYASKSIDKVEKNMSTMMRELLINPQLEGIMEKVQSPEEASYLFSLILEETTHSRSSYKKFNWSHYVDEKSHLSSLFEDTIHLKKVVYGEAEMESTFERLSETLPTLKSIKKLFVEICLEVLEAQFPDRAIEDKFLTELELRLYILIPSYASPGKGQETLYYYSEKSNPIWRPSKLQFGLWSQFLWPTILKFLNLGHKEKLISGLKNEDYHRLAAECCLYRNGVKKQVTCKVK